MSIFVFSSKNLTNIWAGIGAGLWAVSKSDTPTHQGRITKSKSMKIGSFGILYCNETQSLTTPFIVFSRPDPELTVKDVWPEEWVLPFKIRALGTPRRQLYKDKAMQVLPTLRASKQTNFGHALPVQAITAFSPSPLSESDWEILIEHLANGATTDAER
jgi:hypothetical protein